MSDAPRLRIENLHVRAGEKRVLNGLALEIGAAPGGAVLALALGAGSLA